MSASVSTPFLHNDRHPQVYARVFAKEMGAKSDDPSKILSHLRSLTAKAIVDKTGLFKDWDVTNPLPWKPCVDGDFTATPVLSGTFEELIKKEEVDR